MGAPAKSSWTAPSNRRSCGVPSAGSLLPPEAYEWLVVPLVETWLVDEHLPDGAVALLAGAALACQAQDVRPPAVAA